MSFWGKLKHLQCGAHSASVNSAHGLKVSKMKLHKTCSGGVKEDASGGVRSIVGGDKVLQKD